MKILKKLFLITCATLTLLGNNHHAHANIKKEAKQFLMETTIEITVTLGAILIVLPLYSEHKNKKYKAPEYVQKQAQEFLDTMTKKNYIGGFFSWCKKKLGYITVYEGALETSFANKPNAVAIAKGLEGIHFRSNTFENNEMTPQQKADLCHEIAHLYNNQTLNQKYEAGNKIWYEYEFSAEKTTIETLYQLGMYEALEEQVLIRTLECRNPETLIDHHPYICGILSTYANLVEKHPEITSHFKHLPQEATDELKKIPHLSWQEGYALLEKKRQESKNSL